MSREQDAVIAEWMGWEWWMHPWGAEYGITLREPGYKPEVHFADFVKRCDKNASIVRDTSGAPHYSADLNAMAPVLKKVGEQAQVIDITWHAAVGWTCCIHLDDGAYHMGGLSDDGAGAENLHTAITDAVLAMIEATK